MSAWEDKVLTCRRGRCLQSAPQVELPQVRESPHLGTDLWVAIAHRNTLLPFYTTVSVHTCPRPHTPNPFFFILINHEYYYHHHHHHHTVPIDSPSVLGEERSLWLECWICGVVAGLGCTVLVVAAAVWLGFLGILGLWLPSLPACSPASRTWPGFVMGGVPLVSIT